MIGRGYGTAGRSRSTLFLSRLISICFIFACNFQIKSLPRVKAHSSAATNTNSQSITTPRFNAPDCVSRLNARDNSRARLLPENNESENGDVLMGNSATSGFDTGLNRLLPRSAGALGAICPEFYGDTSVIPRITPDLVATMFPGARRANIELYLPMVVRGLAELELVDKTMVLMALATIRAETAQFEPVSELASELNTPPNGEPFSKYDWRANLGNTGPPDGKTFRGRGFIQLTGRRNYQRYGELLGYDLISNPELANVPQPAAQILAAYLKDNELAIRSALAAGDLAAARKIVNGGGNGLDRFTAACAVGDQLIR